MNRRIIIDPQDEPWGWRLLTSVLVFLGALAIAALLSIDDVDTAPRRPLPVEFQP